MKHTQSQLLKLAEKIRIHAYTWGPSQIILALDEEDLVTPYSCGRLNPFPTENAYEFEISTNIRDVTGLERDPDILLVFTLDGRYAKYSSYDRLPEVNNAKGEPRIFNVNNPGDAQKPYATHGFQ